ncbi:MAG: winged helix-turn-helix domain-containing protein [Microscillaceae bacterium]|jgi:DNA-binding transcriptional ArsR family regulator|nr:winged helix-turn-helix domain-containing protein [Microscillaceae bacterium]
MGLTKSEVFSEEQNQIAEYAKAFAHPARVAILQYLLEHRECICGDLVEVLPLSQSTVSQHLKELKRIGIIKGTIEPPKVCYCIDEQAWDKVQMMFEGVLNALQRTGCC